MGCGLNKVDASGKPKFSASEIEMMKSNWRIMEQSIANIGINALVSMFESRPELKDAFHAFKGKNLTELQHTGLIRAHALRVMATVDKCISRLDEPSNLANLMIEMGRHHRQYNVNPDYIQYIATPFINAIKPHIEEYWSDDVEKAWRTLFDLMTYYMTSGMRKTSKNENSFESVT